MEVGVGDRGPGFDLDSGDEAGAVLNDDVDLGTVFVAVVEEPGGAVVPAGLAPQFLVHERLGELAEQTAGRIVNTGRRRTGKLADD